MIGLKQIISDSEALRKKCVTRNGFVFTTIDNPANVYDAILIKHPHSARCFCPNRKGSELSLEEHIEFINKYQLEKALIIADNIDFITRCPSLKYFSIIPADSAGDGFDYSPLYQMPQIRGLHFATVYGFRDEFSTSIDCAKLNGLECLDVSKSGYDNFRSLTTLKSLAISGLSDKDLSDVFCSPSLDSLMAIQCKLKSLEGIQQSEAMQCLYLYYNRSLQDIGALLGVKKTLKALKIENCPKIEDFSVLAELENLELLFLLGSNSLPNLDFLKSLKNLKTFIFSMNVLDGDLSLCKGLSYVYSQNNRRHYNCKDAELPKGEYVRGNESIDEWRRFG